MLKINYNAKAKRWLGRGKLHKIKVNMLKCCQCFKMPEMMMMMTTRTRTTKCSAPQAISAWQFSDIRSNARVELNFKSISKEKNKRAAQEARQIAGGNGNGRIAEAVVKFNNFRFSIYFSLATRCGFASLLAPSTTLQVSAGCGKVN